MSLPSLPLHNRLLAVMAHTSRYAFCGQARLAADAGVSRSTICRLIAGSTNPTFSLMLSITQALEQQLGNRLDPRELVSFDGMYPTPSVCDLCGCRGCLPEEAYTAEDTLHPAYNGLKPSQWAGSRGSSARAPHQCDRRYRGAS